MRVHLEERATRVEMAANVVSATEGAGTEAAGAKAAAVEMKM